MGLYFIIMKILKKLLQKLNDSLTAERQSYPDDIFVGSSFKFGNHKVWFSFTDAGCEVEVVNTNTGKFLDNVAHYLSQHCLSWEEIELDTEPDDIWNNHGFSSESDYLKYRYG